MKNTWALLLLLSCPLCAWAQVPDPVCYDQNSGLSSSVLHSLAQDGKGYIWVGSDNGCFRFDGKSFRHYDEKSGLKNLEILNFVPLNNGELFLIPFLNEFAYLKKGQVINSNIHPELKKIRDLSQRVFWAYDSIKGSLLISSYMEIDKLYEWRDNKVKKISLPGIGTATMLRIDPPKQEISYITRDAIKTRNWESGVEKSIPFPEFNGDYALMQGNILICNNLRRARIFLVEEGRPPRLLRTLHFDEDIYKLLIDRENKLWVSLQNGEVFYMKDELSGSGEAHLAKIISEVLLRDVLIDRDRNVWLSSREKGIYFFNGKQFRSYLRLPEALSTASVSAMAAKGDTLILGFNTLSGAIYYPDGQFKGLRFAEGRLADIKAICYQDERAFFASESYIYQVDLRQGHITQVAFDGPSIKNIYAYGKDSLLIPSSYMLASYRRDASHEDRLLIKRSYAALQFDTDSLFVCGLEDLYKLNPRTKASGIFLKDCFLKDIQALGKDRYVGATSLSGLRIFDRGGKSSYISREQGLISNNINRVRVENDSVFWACSSAGLSRLVLQGDKLRVQNFTRADGLPSDRVHDCQLRDGWIYLATARGLAGFEISELLQSRQSLTKRVIINSVNIGGKEVQQLATALVSPYPFRDVIFDLSFLDYESMGHVAYKYQVEGLSDRWQTSTSPRIILNALAPGHYTFKVYGISSNGSQSVSFTEVNFEVQPAFWQTWWFMVLVALLCLLIFYWIVASALRKKREERIKTLVYEKKAAELELQAIKAQINPHFIYNCLNSIQYLMYKKDYHNTENYLDVFSRMIRKTLQYSEKTFIPVQEEVEYLSFYLELEKLRFKDGFNYDIRVSKRVGKHFLMPSLLIQPFVENAIKHGINALQGEEGRLDIAFDYQASVLTITIADNGYGIDYKPSSKGEGDSFGIRLTEKRIETFKQLFQTYVSLDISDRSGQGERGTLVTLQISLYHEANHSRNYR